MLQTILYELAFYVNLRPLTKFQDDILCPASFLYGVPTPVSVIGPCIDITDPTEHWRRRVSALLELKRNFKRLYLSTLRTWRNPGRLVRVPSVGDIVIVEEDNLKRTSWKMARVQSQILGTDGACRAVEILMNGRLTRRALERIYVIETEVPRTDVVQPNVQRTVLPQAQGVIPNLPPTVVQDAQPDVPVPATRTRRGREVRLPARLLD